MTAISSAAASPPLILDEVTVAAVRRLSPSFVRVELAGPALADLPPGPHWDQRIKLVFPSDAGRLPSLAGAEAGSWWQAWLALPEDERGYLRTYTIRAVRGFGEATRLVVDLVLHLEPGAAGPASAWASRASLGDRLLVIAPRRGVDFGGIEFTPDGARRLLLVGDETAVPAISSILESLPSDVVGEAYLEVPCRDDVLDVRRPAGLRVTWLPRHGEPHGDALTRAVLGRFAIDALDDSRTDASGGASSSDVWETPTYSSSGAAIDPVARIEGKADHLYAWVAGESGTVARLRRHLLRDAGLDRRQVAFMGYWRIGVAMR